MSFTFRSAEENFISALPSKVADIFYSDYYESISDEFKFLNSHFSFSLDSNAKEYVAERGIRVSPFGTMTHPHPVSKILENHLLFNVLPRFIQPNSHLAVFSIKETKAEYLYFRAKDFSLDVMNRFLLAQDYGRYSNRTVISGGHNNFYHFVHNLVLRFKKKTPDLLFFHDELMHWRFDEFVYFLARVKPKNLAFTFVYPIEDLAGISRSCNSVAYDFEKIDDDLLFFPDKSKQQPYIHRGSINWPFYLNEVVLRINNEEIRYSLDLVETHGAHHFFILKPDSPIKQKYRSFKDFDCTHFKDLSIDGIISPIDGTIRTKILSKVFNYLTCLKKKDVESALAKLRQLTEGKLMKDELLIVNDLASLLSKYSLSPSPKDLIDWIDPTNWLTNFFPESRMLDFLFGVDEDLAKTRLRELSRNIKPFSLTIHCKKIFIDFNKPILKEGQLSGSLSSGLGSISGAIANELNTICNVALRDILIINKDVVTPVCRLSSSADDPSDSECYSDEDDSDHRPDDTTKFKETNFELNTESDTDDDDKFVESLQVETIKEKEPEELDKNLLRRIQDGLTHDQADGSGFKVSDEIVKESNQERIDKWVKERKNGCFLTAVCSTVSLDPFSVLNDLKAHELDEELGRVLDLLSRDLPLPMDCIRKICEVKNWRVWIYLTDDILKVNDHSDLRPIQIGGKDGHLFKLNDLSFFRHCGLLERAYMEIFNKIPIITKYVPSHVKAKHLLNSFSSMQTGALIDKRRVERGDIVEKKRMEEIRSGKLNMDNIDAVNIVPFLGFAGSGKTRSLFKIVDSSFIKIPFLWISPRAKVLKEIVSKINRGYEMNLNVPFQKQFMTFEKALLLKELPKLIIIDEAPLLPPGYLDLLLLKKGVDSSTSIALIGDPLQCRYHCQDSIMMAKSSIDLFDVIKRRINEGVQTDYLAVR